MSYDPVVLHDFAGVFRGYAIIGERNLQSTNVYGDAEKDELAQRITDLNENDRLRQYWPDPKNDPDVQALLSDENFMPIQGDDTSLDNAYAVYLRVQEACKAVAIDRAAEATESSQS